MTVYQMHLRKNLSDEQKIFGMRKPSTVMWTSQVGVKHRDLTVIIKRYSHLSEVGQPTSKDITMRGRGSADLPLRRPSHENSTVI